VTPPTLAAYAREVFAAALAAADPVVFTRAALDGAVGNDPSTKACPHRIISVGKAAPAMAREAIAYCESKGRHVVGGIVVGAAKTDESLGPLELFVGDHPIPFGRSAHAADRLEAQCDLAAGDVVIVLISGGTSALVGAPVFGLSQTDFATLYELLIGAGLDITRVNSVRKRFAKWGAGRLASALTQSVVIPILLSDVPDDDIASIGSGPCSPDEHSAADVEEILRDARIATRIPLAMAAYLGAVIAGSLPETPKPGSVVFDNVRPPTVGNNATALRAAERAATIAGRSHGIQRVVLDQRPLGGDAADAGRAIARAALAAQPGSCLLLGGETTVRLPTGHGLGGRNQQLALAAAQTLHDAGGGAPRVTLLAAGTDGRDGPTDAAVAIVDNDSWDAVTRAGLDPRSCLARCDANPALDAAGALLRTGLTGTNVGDVIIALRSQSA
jgi:glycerate-2-kinase